MVLGMKNPVSMTLILSFCQKAQGSAHHALLSQWQGGLQLGRKEAFGSQDLMMKREDTHRGNLKLEKMVTENPGSACFRGLGNHLHSPLNQRACHTKDKSGEWPRPDTGCLGLYCEETGSCMESIWNL